MPAAANHGRQGPGPGSVAGTGRTDACWATCWPRRGRAPAPNRRAGRRAGRGRRAPFLAGARRWPEPGRASRAARADEPPACARVADACCSQATNAILTTFNEVNMAPVMEMRKRFQEKFEKEHGVKIGFMSFFVKAAVAALKKYRSSTPASTATTSSTTATSTSASRSARRAAWWCHPAQCRPDELRRHREEDRRVRPRPGRQAGHRRNLTGGTFSISNGGTFGSMLSTPIINPPQSAILGRARHQGPRGGGERPGRRAPMNYLAMSYDHRIIDGREAVLGLVAMKEALEDPARLLFDI